MRRTILPTVLCAATLSLLVASADAQNSLQNSFRASAHASKAAILGVAASGQAVFGIAAVPMLSIGTVASAIGTGSTTAGKAATDIAMGHASLEPLPLTEEAISVMPPSEALKLPATNPPRPMPQR